MAIDDNTLYGLTGAQIKELPERIDAVKGQAKVLTDADFNYPTNNPTKLDLWLLPEGIYDVSAVNPQKIKVTNAWYGSNTDSIGLVIITDVYVGPTLKKNITFFTPNSYDNNTVFSTCVDTSGVGTPGGASVGRLLNGYGIVDGLASNDSQKVLSANQGRALKNLIDSLAIRGAGAPTTATVGQVGTLYEDTTNGDLYICTDATNPYVWEEVGGGGGGPTVVQTTGSSTTDVMSQSAVSGMVYLFPNSTQTIRIGNTATVGSLGVGIGYNSKATGDRAVGLGYGATATKSGAVAIGSGSNATSQGQMDIGTTATSYGYNSSNYRLLTGLYDGQSAHDAVTVGQVNSVIDAINTALSTNIPHIGA